MGPFADGTPFLRAPRALFAFAADHGHCVLRALIDPSLVARAAAAAIGELNDLGLLQRGQSRLADGFAPSGTGYDDPRWIQLQQRCLPHPVFTTLGNNHKLLAALQAVVGGPLAPITGNIVRVGWPERFDLTTAPHQDQHYIGLANVGWTVWLPLSACPLELGPLAVVNRSHRNGLFEHDRDAQPGVRWRSEWQWRSAPLQPGDVVLFHSLAVHGALPNTLRDALRLSYDFRIRGA